ncbi:hypothetical protein DBV05_g10208 [Lasiodiplodia theobromae]|uniref:Uncharacterized protein n=1 Tax=Lasiodiplodia theobromae TaxID=45133 RepID=A0A5N5D0E1_9PEZI|nr:hypothetical protein DBV05_g10208 [Lasiodiplodia theobromae]
MGRAHYVRVEYLIDILESGLFIMTTASKITAMYLTWVIIGFGLGSAQSRDYNPLQTEHVYDAHVGADQHGPLARACQELTPRPYTGKVPPHQEAPTGTTNTDHEAALLDEPWNEVPHNAPQTLKAGVGS